MKRIAFLVCLALMLLSSVSLSQEIPTLVPPTLVPQGESGAEEALLAESAVVRIINRGVVRVGILYNEPPFGELNPRGEVSGFDADLARAIAETWGIELRLRQVTRQTAADDLRTGRVDMLIAAQVHRRDLDFEFSQTYHLASQSMMVRAGDTEPKTLAELANRRIGVVDGTYSEVALNNFATRTGIPFQIQPYPTLDRAYGALIGREVDGVIGSRHRLVRVALQPDVITILEEAIEQEPYAIAMPRQDVNLRNLVNQTLQHLRQTGKLAELRQTYFPESSYALTLWSGLGTDAPKPDQFTASVTYPGQYVVPRLQGGGAIRVAGLGLVDLNNPDLPEGDRRIETFQRGLIEEITRRWGVSVEYITTESPLESVANGQADIAMGVQPNWDWDERVDFTNPYLLRGLRLLVRKDSNIFGFAELLGGRTVAVPLNQAGIVAIATEEARQQNAIIRTVQIREQDFAIEILENRNADVAFADSVRLIPILEQYPNDFRLTERWYSEEYIAFATPRNDIDFRLLLEYTLQELIRDGTLDQLLRPVILPDDMPDFVIYPGVGNTYGFNITR
ncbi:MAG: transporter substrate-binding domain-containing protein [Anaerolineae bacterium]|nr:transporter substrate-binding domain-containing protein [Anaerolineae bacterium]